MMFALGVRLTLGTGREALVRLIVTAVAVAIGVTIMLAVLADFHAFELTSHRPEWEGTQAMTGQETRTAGVELWNYSDEVYAGQTIERLDVAALGPGAPVPPGIPTLPRPGQYYASPALAALIRSVPPAELGDRFGGRLAGTIGQAALTGPAELVVYLGDSPRSLARSPSTIRVDKINTSPGRQVWTPYFRDAFVVGAIAFLMPIVILVGTATKLASARREERYAALRLVGATAGDVNVISSADAIVTALLGALLGMGLFAALRPVLASTAITSARYFPAEITPTVWGYLGVLVAVPAASAAATLLALRRVRVTPLGVSRRVTQPLPRSWRMVPLLIGVILFVIGMLGTNATNIGAPALPGLAIVMIGLLIGGPWLTAAAARLVPRLRRGAAPIYVARRLADQPKAAFRAVSGLVLAMFLGTMVAALLPAVNATIATPDAVALRNVLLDGFWPGPVCGNNVNCTGGVRQGGSQGSRPGLRPAAGRRLLAGLRTFHGIIVAPVYSLPAISGPGYPGQYTAIVNCAQMAAIAALGRCAPGVRAAEATSASLYGDNPMYTSEPIVSRSAPAARAAVSGLYLQAVLIKVPGPAMLERVRTYLITHTRDVAAGPAARTFGEAVQVRQGVAATLLRLVDVAVALTLLVAGCGLAVAAAAGVLERKRPFTLMRLAGTPMGTLSRVVLAEAALPLVAAATVAATTAYGLSLLILHQMAPPGTALPTLGRVYYLTVGSGLVISLAVIATTLPLLHRITSPESVRFE